MKEKMNKRMALSVVALAIMALAADITGEREVIFPEVAALAVGLWIADKRIWNVRYYEIPLIMTASAVIGVMITTYITLPVFWQLTLAFFISAALMTVLNIPLIPSIAAVLLPVLLHTESWFYPASVAVMTTIMAAGQAGMQHWGLKSKLTPVAKQVVSFGQSLHLWGSRYVLLLPLFIVATWHGWLFAIVPPLMIILIELSNPANMFRSRPWSLWATVAIVAAIGTASRFLFIQMWAMPYTVAVPVAFLTAILLMRKVKLMFPPIPALAVIPFILPDNYIMFPVEAALGGAYVIVIPLLIGKIPRLKTISIRA